MTQTALENETAPAWLEDFDRLEKMYSGEARRDEDLSLCFLCLRWTTGDEGCRRGDRCELLRALDA